MDLIRIGLGIASAILEECHEAKAKAIVDAIADALPAEVPALWSV